MTFQKIAICALFLTVFSQNSLALVDVPSFRFGLGYSPMTFVAGQITGDTPQPLENFLTLKPTLLWNIPQLRSRIGLHYLMDLGSPYGFVNIAGIGATYLLYPLGLSRTKETKADDIELVKTRISPFLEVAFTPTRFSVTRQRGVNQQDYFSSYLYELMVGAGGDYPFENGVVVFGGVYYRNAFSKKLETTVGSLGYSGVSVQFGALLTFD